ncbi:MAG: spondin domain-containing protein [Chloroflexi bacterium]|nr:spondin domain-containing protein [Chloroflexota bacterium]
MLLRLRRPRNLAVIAALSLLLAAALAPGASYAGGPNVATYRVTIVNLTDGQPLTPPLLATHQRATGLFSVGDAASPALQQIAENGNLAPMIDLLNNDTHVHEVVAGDAPIIPASDPGNTPFRSSATFEISAAQGAKWLSWASMLICTNDGFTGVDTLRLPRRVGETVAALTAGYDAGTEVNTEDFADMVPPCPPLTGVPSSDPGTGESNPALAEGGVIMHHPGIQGGEDLDPAIHGWTDPVALIVVERIS